MKPAVLLTRVISLNLTERWYAWVKHRFLGRWDTREEALEALAGYDVTEA
jgi:hypothetical protein